jgi:hypothetical protein
MTPWTAIFQSVFGMLKPFLGPLLAFFAGKKTQRTNDQLAGAQAELEIRREDDAVEQKVDGMTAAEVDSELSKWTRK